MGSLETLVSSQDSFFSLLWPCLGRESQCLGLDPSLDALVNSALHPSVVA